jgi:hypothetical protein
MIVRARVTGPFDDATPRRLTWSFAVHPSDTVAVNRAVGAPSGLVRRTTASLVRILAVPRTP